MLGSPLVPLGCSHFGLASLRLSKEDGECLATACGTVVMCVLGGMLSIEIGTFFPLFS